MKKMKKICKTCYFMDENDYERITGTHRRGRGFECVVNKNRDIYIKCCENWIDRDIEKESRFTGFVINLLESIIKKLENFKERLIVKPYSPILWLDERMGEFRRGVLGHIPNDKWSKWFSDKFLINTLNDEIELVEEWGDKDKNEEPINKYYWRISIPKWYRKIYEKELRR